MAAADVRVMSLLVVVVAIAAASGAMMTASASSDLATDCKGTIAQGDEVCGDALIHAYFSHNSDLISVDCCKQLSCFREPSCTSSLRTVCGTKWNERCDPPPPPPAAVDAIAS